MTDASDRALLISNSIVRPFLFNRNCSRLVNQALFSGQTNLDTVTLVQLLCEACPWMTTYDLGETFYAAVLMAVLLVMVVGALVA